MKHTPSKSHGMTKHMCILPIFLIAAVALILGAAALDCRADDETPFDVAHLFFELNDTDGDLGIHALVDGDAWKKLEIEDPGEREILNIRVKGRLGRQGLTELFFESAEPPFESDDPDEVTLSPEQFFRRFPAGTYEIEGITLDGEELESEVELTHVIPAPPEVSINGIAAAEDCDAELPVVDSNFPVFIEWKRVEMSHEEIGKPDVPLEGDHEVVNYEVIVEIDETPWKTSAILPPTATSFEIPQEILNLVDVGDEIKFEVLVREASYNQTAIESCFVKGPLPALP